VFFGLSLTSVSVGDNKFTSFILVALIELPAYVVFYFTMDRFGRRSTLGASLILSGMSCISFAFIPTGEDHPYLDNSVQIILFLSLCTMTASVVKWSEFLATDPEVRARFPALPDFLGSTGSGTVSTQPREYN
jgi:MFS family permease